jgi:hypothetical protein
MPELTIRLVVDPHSGKKNVVIHYESDADALPMEHEEEHRRLVDRLIEGGALSAAELGRIVIEREQPAGSADAAGEEEAAAAKARRRDSRSEEA